MITETDYPGRSGPLAHDAPFRNHGYSGLGCGCNPGYSQSCPTCADKPSGRVTEAIPPCMQRGFDPDAAHQAVLARYRESAARLGIAPYSAPYDLSGGTA